MVFKEEYFTLYDLFLEVDILHSLIDGRRRDIILQFQNLFFLMLQQQNKQQQNGNRLLACKKKLINMLMSYCDEHEYKIDGFKQNSIGYLCFADKNNIISQSCQHYHDGVKLYVCWRNKLRQANKQKAIYRHNITDRLRYYFEKNQQFLDRLIFLFKDSKLITSNATIARQSLSEFHNAMSHLCIAYKNNNYELNMQRACNHLQRGALDTYKIIIKDYWVLSKCPKDDELYDDFLELRKQENKNIGCDNERLKLLEKYKSLIERAVKMSLC